MASQYTMTPTTKLCKRDKEMGAEDAVGWAWWSLVLDIHRVKRIRAP